MEIMPTTHAAALPPMITASTTFEEAFDILFVRGGFSAFKSCWDFIKLFETPTNGPWVHTLCTCRFVELLPHPMYGVLLLIPEVRSVEESHLTWDLARECSVATVDCETLVRVMRVFCPRKNEQVLFGGAWCTSQLHETRSKTEWVSFGRNALNGISFTAMWWAQEENLALEGSDMRLVVQQMAKKECDMLRFKLLAHAKKEMLEEKVCKVGKLREEKKKNSGEKVNGDGKQLVQVVIDCSSESVSSGKKAKKAKTDGATQKTGPVRLSKEDLKAAEAASVANTDKHIRVIAALERALVRTGVELLDCNLAGIVASLAAAYPRIKWNLKGAVHGHFKSQTAWEIERELHGYTWFEITEDPLATLEYWESVQ